MVWVGMRAPGSSALRAWEQYIKRGHLISVYLETEITFGKLIQTMDVACAGWCARMVHKDGAYYARLVAGACGRVMFSVLRRRYKIYCVQTV